MHSPGIYKITNITNNKVYIGASNDLLRRKWQHFTSLKSGKHKNKYLQNSYNKYGCENFVFEILEVCDISLLSKREHYWANFYKANDSNFGYNKVITSEKSLYSGIPAGWHHTKEAIEKIRKSSLSEERRKISREYQKKCVIANTGAKRSYEVRLKMQKAKKGENRIIQIFTNDFILVDECNFISDASKLTGVKISTIKNNLCGISKKTKLFTFKWKEVYHR